MTIRLIGAVMILSGSGVLGYLMSSAYRREIKLLCQFLELLDAVECELQYRQEPLPAIFDRISKNRSEEVFILFSALADELRSQIQPDVQSCLYSVMSKHSNLPCSLAGLVNKFGRTLGQYSAKGQLLELEAVRQEAKHLKEHLETEQKVKIKNYRALSICAGAAVVIILI